MEKKKLVVLSGAGISAESGLRTFRDSDGLWEGYEVTQVATPGAWRRDPKLVLDFYNMRRRDVASATPNAAHLGLAALERNFDVTIITQNIDDLHERAGSSNIIHLHGEIFKMRSEADEETLYDIRADMNAGDLAEDGSLLRPAIVWFEEAVPKIEQAVTVVHAADILVIIGTSLVVYPAAGLLHYASEGIPKFVIDKRLPPMGNIMNMTAIEKKATEGIVELIEALSVLH